MGSSHTYYDETLTQSLWNKFVNDNTSHVYYSWRLGSRGTLQVTGSHGSSSQFDGEDVYYNYMNFRAINGVDFAHTVDSNGSTHAPGRFDLWDNTSMANVTLTGQGILAGENVKLDNITYMPMDWYGGYVEICGAGASLNNLTAPKDYEEVVIYGLASGSVSAANVSVGRRLWSMTLGGGDTGVPHGSGISAEKITVGGVVKYVNVGAGAVLNSLTVGSQRSWAAADSSAFVWYDSGWGSWTHSSATYMKVDSGGTATNIYLGNGGDLYVSGPSDTVTSQWNSSTEQMVYTTHFASGQGGVVENLRMATAGALNIDGVTDVRAIWNYPTNGYGNSRGYMSGFLATAPQSAYVRFASNTIGRNISIGNGGTMTVDKGGSVTNISMGALTTSTYYTNSSGRTDVWVGDRGAKLTVNGGFASDVIIEAAPMTFDYYSAAHDYFWLYSSSIKDAYSSAHGSYGSGSAWDAEITASASAGYRQYMSKMFVSGAAVYTNYGDDAGYNRKWVGGEVSVANGGIYNLYGFATLRVTHIGEGTSSAGSVTYSAFSMENVSKASGVVSATVEVGGGAHLTSVTAPGGYVVMGYGSGIYRWAGQSNPQSNFARVENLDLRTSGLVGDNNSAVIFFSGYTGGGGWSTPRKDSKGNTIKDDEGNPIYDSYSYLCVDPGEIVYASGDKGLTVKGTYGSFTYTGSGAIVFGGLGTVVLKDNHSRYCSDSYHGKGPYLGSAFDTYYFGVVKGPYDEEDGVMIGGAQLDDARLPAGSKTFGTILDGSNGFDWTGVLAIGSGALLRNVGTSAGFSGGLFTTNTLQSDSWNPVVEEDKSKMLYVVAGGVAKNVKVVSAITNYEHISSSLYRTRAALIVSSGGTALDVTVVNGGVAMAIGGVINGAFVGNGGILYLSGWGGAHQIAVDSYGSQLAGPQYLDATTLNDIRLGSGGHLYATYDWGFGGNAPNITANADGGVLNGVTANGVAYVSGLDYAGAITLTNGQQAVDVTVRGYKKITSRDDQGNPTAYTTAIASLNVSSGGIVNGATVGEEGAIYVSTGANVKNLTASGGRIIFANSSGWSDYFAGSATVSGIAVLAGGELEVNSKFGLKTSDMRIGEGAGLTFTLGDTASEDYTPTELNGTWTAAWGNGSFYTDDGTMSGFGGQFGQEYKDLFYSSSYVSARLSMTVAKGGTLTGADLRGYGSVLVTSGGKIINTRIKGVTVNVGASGYASGLYAATESTGSAYDTNIYVYGSGAVVENTVLSGGYLGVERGGVANGVAMFAPEGYTGPFGNQTEVGPAELEIYAGGTANNVVASAGVITLLEGSKEPGTAAPTLSNADVHYSATLIVNCDGAVLDGTLNLGGLVTTTATRYEYVAVEVTDPATGNTYTDWQSVEKNNAVAVANTLTVNFDLTEREGEGEDAMIDNLANLAGAKLGTITVDADQAEGVYVLANGAGDFTGSVTVKRGTENLGAFTVGTYYQYDEDTMYSLTNGDETGLCFTIQTTAAAVTKIVATVDGRELLAGQWSNKSITIKAQGNKSAKSIWYRIHKAVITRGGAKNGDEWLELDSDNGVTVSQFCDIEIRAKDANGNFSESTTYRVNYDDTPATITDLVYTYDTTATGKVCTVSALVADDLDDAPTVEIPSGTGEWQALELGADGRYAFTVAAPGEYKLRATDHAGNVSEATATVTFPAAAATPGDLNGDGRADVIMTIAQAGHGAEGATGAWLIQADQTAAWGDLSQRNAGWSIFGAGVTTAGKATNDVYIKSDDNVVGAWVTGDDGKVTGWQTIESFDTDTQVLGLGDFNGDGQTDLLLRNVNGAVGCYFTSGDKLGWNYFQSLGDEWKIAAVGDLNGDGRSDVVLKHDAGFAGSWLTQADGTMAWADLDTLSADFEIVGTGDFDGDGTDDVLLKKDTYYGAWLVENGNAAGWFGIGDLGSVSVEQIADFDGDGIADLRLRTGAGDLGAQLVRGADTLEWKYYGSVGTEWITALAAI